MPGAESIINAFVAGRQIRDAQLRQQQEAEDRKLEQETLALRLRQLKLQEKLQARQLAQQNVELLEGRPEADLTMGGVLPARAGAGVVAAPGADGPAQMDVSRTLVTPRRQVTIPGVEELGVDAVTVQPQSMEEILAARAAEERRNILRTPREIGGRLVVPQGAGGQPEVLYEPPKEEKAVTFAQPEVAIVNGRRAYIVRGSDNQWYLPGTTTPFTGRVQPLPEKAETPKTTDDPQLPRGVAEYLSSFVNKTKWDPTTRQQVPYTFEDARAEVAATWPKLTGSRAQGGDGHTQLDPLKVDTALRNLFRPAPGAQQDEFSQLLAAMFGGTPPAGSGAPTARTPSSGRGATPPAAAQPAQPSGPAGNGVAVGQVVTVRGKQIKVTKVYPDGSFDGEPVK